MKVTDYIGAAQELGRPVALFPKLRLICKSMSDVVFLCQMIYWSDKGHDKDGWIYKEATEIEEETGLTYDEQRTVRRHLIEAGYLQEHYERLSHRMYFRLNRDAVNHDFSEKTDLSNSPNPQSQVPELGIVDMGKSTLPSSLIESEITPEITSQNKYNDDDIAATEKISQPAPTRPDSFRTYEQEIGPLTPMIADALKDFEVTYTADWTIAAIKEASLHGARNMAYIKAVLQGWQANGFGNRPGNKPARQAYQRSNTGFNTDELDAIIAGGR